jgi:hypothetical protein
MRTVLAGSVVLIASLAVAVLWAHSAPIAPSAGTWVKDVLCERNPTWMVEVNCPGSPPCTVSGYKCVYWWNPRGDCTRPVQGAACMETDRYTEVSALRADCVTDQSGVLCVCGTTYPISGVRRTIDDCQ